MTTYGLTDRLEENRATRHEFIRAFTLGRFGASLAILAAFIFIVGYFNQHTILSIRTILSDFYANVSSELLSIVITVVVLDRLQQRRQNAQDLQRLKALMASDENMITKIAVAELRARGWLEDGSLQGANLERANLQGARLRYMNLQAAYLDGANLQEADLSHTNLQKAFMMSANLQATNLKRSNLQAMVLDHAQLQGADLVFANLQAAGLIEAKLQGARLLGAKLQGACLVNANLQGAKFGKANLTHTNMFGVVCDSDTILPNREHWTPDVKWSQFGAVELDWLEWDAYEQKHGFIDDEHNRIIQNP